MLQALHVRDLALVGHAEVRFDRGLNVLSGETGGGKSLIVTALKLLRGERASARLIRHGCEELRVDGEFVLGDGERSAAARAAVAEVIGGQPEGGVLVVTRIVDASGRSRVRIDGRPSTLQELREVCGHLLEIHGQGETRALMRPEIQAETLDAFGKIGALRRDFARALTAARAAAARVDDAAGLERARLERIEFLRYQLQEMDAFGVEAGELAGLEDEHSVLANLDRLRDGLASALGALSEDEASALDAIGRARRALEDALEVDRSLAEAAAAVGEAEVALHEAVRALQSRLGDLDLDPQRLGAVEDRLAELRRALKRFGPTEEAFLAARAAAAAELDALDGGPDGGGDPEAALRDALADLETAGRKLLRGRRKAAAALVTAIERELAGLGMPHTRFRVAMLDELPSGRELLAASTPHGPGPVDFEVRINPGEPFHPMRATASGGETARIVLAVKKCLADQDRVPFLVFDEIDAEIGGRLGIQVGAKLGEVARHHQVLIVTHLPQVAAFADAHFKVGKQVRADRTFSTIERLDTAAAEAEIAAMAAGDGDEALLEARRLRARATRARQRPERAAEA